MTIRVPTAEWQVADFVDEARRRARLDDVGTDEYREGLAVLLDAYRRRPASYEPALGPTLDALVQLLAARLRAEEQLREHGRRSSVRQPWLVLSMPRSGSTAVHRLLCADPAAQGLERWLGIAPQPRPARSAWPEHPDFVACDDALGRARAANPELLAMHEMAADEVDECNLLLRQSFRNLTFFQTATVPAYEQWLWTCDMTETYARFRAMLELIGDERRWVLKDPSHLMHLDAALGEFPDLRIVHIKRPLPSMLASTAALVFAVRSKTEPVTRQQVGRAVLDGWAECARAFVNWRTRHPEVPYAEVSVDDLRREPVATLAAAYRGLGEHLSDEAAEQVRAKGVGLRAGQNPQPVTLDDFGLADEEAYEAFPAEFH